MLMMDRITDISGDAGLHGKGYVVAEFDIHPDLWFFPCHFPAQPDHAGLSGGWTGWGRSPVANGR